jgi:hypothetical protein
VANVETVGENVVRLFAEKTSTAFREFLLDAHLRNNSTAKFR